MTISGAEDDASIADETVLWRRVHPDQIVPGHNNETCPSSQAFQNTSGTDRMSVNIAEETTIEDTLRGYEDHFIVAIEAGFVRGQNQGVIRRPREDNPAHAEVTGNKTRGVRKRLSAASQWVVRPEPLIS